MYSVFVFWFLFLVRGDTGNKNARCLVQLGSQLGVDQIR